MALLEAEIIEPEKTATHSVIWMHGLGADGHDFTPVVPELGLPADAAVRFIFPHAPVRPVTLNMGMQMRAWYDLYALDLSKGEDEAGLLESEADISNWIQHENGLGIADENIILAGFSQGGAVALLTGLRYPRRIGGIIALSTYMPMRSGIDVSLAKSNIGLPVFMAHGFDDNVIAWEVGERSRHWLEQHHYDVDWHSYHIGHTVSMDEIADIGRFITTLLEKA